jgi:hypothetical protein
LQLEHPDLGKMLENLRLPVVVTGTLNVDARLKDAGKLTQLDVDAKLGDNCFPVHLGVFGESPRDRINDFTLDEKWIV